MSRQATTADYLRLGLAVSATQDEARAAFRLLAKRYHPDHNQGDEIAAKRFTEVRESYEAICTGPSPALTATLKSHAVQTALRARTLATPAPLSLQTMTGGDSLWIGYEDVVVGPDRTCYVNINAVIRTVEKSVAPVRIEYHGGYEVHLPEAMSYIWTVEAQPSGLSAASLWIGGKLCDNAQLPANLLLSTIGNMAFDTPAWAVARAIVVDDLGCWVDPSETVVATRTLTSQVRIERHPNGYHVTADGRPTLWRAQGRVAPRGFVLATRATLGGVPVQSQSSANR